MSRRIYIRQNFLLLTSFNTWQISIIHMTPIDTLLMAARHTHQWNEFGLTLIANKDFQTCISSLMMARTQNSQEGDNIWSTNFLLRWISLNQCDCWSSSNRTNWPRTPKDPNDHNVDYQEFFDRTNKYLLKAKWWWPDAKNVKRVGENLGNPLFCFSWQRGKILLCLLTQMETTSWTNEKFWE